MDRTKFGDFEQPALLGFIEVSGQFDFSIDTVEKTLLRFTVSAIFCVDAGMLKANGHALQIESLALSVQAQSHRCTGAEAGKQELVGRRSGVGPEWRRLVGAPPVFTGDNLLG